MLLLTDEIILLGHHHESADVRSCAVPTYPDRFPFEVGSQNGDDAATGVSTNKKAIIINRMNGQEALSKTNDKKTKKLVRRATE